MKFQRKISVEVPEDFSPFDMHRYPGFYTKRAITEHEHEMRLAADRYAAFMDDCQKASK